MGGLTRRPIPERQYFKIGEVASVVGVSTSAIRFYQREFWPHVRPARTRAKHHVYTRRDVMVLGMIRTLVHDQKYTIRGAKERLAELLAEHGGDPEKIDLGQGELPLSADGSGSGGDATEVEERARFAEKELERIQDEWESTRRRIVQAVNELLQEVE